MDRRARFRADCGRTPEPRCRAQSWQEQRPWCGFLWFVLLVVLGFHALNISRDLNPCVLSHVASMPKGMLKNRCRYVRSLYTTRTVPDIYFFSQSCAGSISSVPGAPVVVSKWRPRTLHPTNLQVRQYFTDESFYAADVAARGLCGDAFLCEGFSPSSATVKVSARPRHAVGLFFCFVFGSSQNSSVGAWERCVF